MNARASSAWRLLDPPAAGTSTRSAVQYRLHVGVKTVFSLLEKMSMPTVARPYRSIEFAPRQGLKDMADRRHLVRMRRALARGRARLAGGSRNFVFGCLVWDGGRVVLAQMGMNPCTL